MSAPLTMTARLWLGKLRVTLKRVGFSLRLAASGTWNTVSHGEGLPICRVPQDIKHLVYFKIGNNCYYYFRQVDIKKPTAIE